MAARREWNERYGSYIAQAHAWRLTALVSLAVTFVAVAGVVWIGAQNRVVPYVVQTDKLGDALAVSRADVAAPADPRLIRAGLARWISDVRTVYLDVAAERAVVNEAYAMVNRNAAAAQQLNDWFSHHDPFKRAQTEMVGVSVESVLPISGNTWRVEWREDERGRDGMADPPTHWQATITISISPPTDDAKILVNPVGLYVEFVRLGAAAVNAREQSYENGDLGSACGRTADGVSCATNAGAGHHPRGRNSRRARLDRGSSRTVVDATDDSKGRHGRRCQMLHPRRSTCCRRRLR